VLVLTCAVLASVASAPPGAEVTGGLAEDRTLVLEPEAEQTLAFRATLAVGGPGAGQIAFSCVSDGSTPGALRLAIASDTTGESTEADVLDVSEQPETSIAIAAFTGCTNGACEERGTVSFERTDGPDAATLEMIWRLDGRFTPDSGDVEGNSLQITIVESEP
jgi:hypothetical protein